MTIKVLVNGASGRMGRLAVTTVEQHNDLECVAKTGRQDDLEQVISQTKPDVAIDFTLPTNVFDSAKLFIKHQVRPIIGTSGLNLAQIEELTQLCQQQQLGAIIAPNFSLGAILMMKYAKDAARYFDDVEIIEMHHPLKVDAPSGTANKTAQMIAEQQQKTISADKDIPAARGDQTHGIPVHSVRLPSLFAHQMVMFGGTGELLTLRYDGMDRQCCMPGVVLSCRKVMSLNHLIYGLEHLID